MFVILQNFICCSMRTYQHRGDQFQRRAATTVTGMTRVVRTAARATRTARARVSAGTTTTACTTTAQVWTSRHIQLRYKNM